jgi:hypothetical protein
VLFFFSKRKCCQKKKTGPNKSTLTTPSPPPYQLQAMPSLVDKDFCSNVHKKAIKNLARANKFYLDNLKFMLGHSDMEAFTEGRLQVQGGAVPLVCWRRVLWATNHVTQQKG